MPLSSTATSTMLVGRQNNLQMARDQTGIAFGLGGGADSNNQPRRSFQHIEDLMVAPAGLSELTSIKDLLRQAEIYLKQALASKSFGRADFALRDYCCARAILDGLIKKNKDWAKLMGGDKKALLGQYEYLVHQAKQLEAEFESVKQEVVENNRLTGVQPTSRPASSHTGGSTLTRGPIDAQNLRPDGSTSGATVTRHHNDQVNGYGYVLKAKPVVLPKPPSLLGNAIKRGGGGPAAASKTSQDLAKRFANLRSSTALSPAPPAFDDTAPKQPRLDTSFCSALPDLPKLPDAIYSPARGTVSSEAAELPSSTPHGIFSRTNSVTSLAGNPKPAKSPLINDYFVPAQSFGGPAARAKRSKPPIPEGNTISPQDLVALMQAGTKQIAILLVDIRPRDEFEMGHIMSQATICIEPDVLLRKDIGAEDIRDSMVVGHSTELKLFEERHRFDLVVFYDASSTRVPLRASKTEDMVVLGLYNALNLYDPAADGDTGRAPKLLRGGIKEWTQLMGSTSLQSSSSGPAPTPGKTTGVSADASHRRASRFNPKPIQDAEEAAHWQTALTDKEAYSHVRSTDDFLRRFPEVGNIQSMSSSSPPQTVSYSAVPAPPTRPAPALPRSSHSGLEDPGVMVQSAQVRKAGTALRQAAGHRRPGLRNPHNWCYANSTLQALFSTRGFSHDLSSGDWIGQYRVPQKKEELINNPQILAKCLQSLFFVLDDGKVEVLDSGVLMRYLVHIHGRNKAPANTFGTSHQQDAAEFWGFLIETLHDETNTRRNISDGVQTCYEGDPRGILEHTQAFWEQYSRENRSIIDHYFGGIHVQTSRCKACNFEVRNFVWMPYLNLTIPAGGAPSKSIESLLQAYCVEEDHKDLKCAKCGNAGRLSTWRIARLPDRLVIFFNRFDAFGDKVHDLITFPMHGLRLDQWFVEGQDRTDDRHYNPQSDYDLYAVVHHAGASLKSGHYIAFAKDHNSANDSSWFELNDQVVTDRTFATATELWSRPSSQQAYMVFYQRRNT